LAESPFEVEGEVTNAIKKSRTDGCRMTPTIFFHDEKSKELGVEIERWG
jgi:hypothetical protein